MDKSDDRLISEDGRSEVEDDDDDKDLIVQFSICSLTPIGDISALQISVLPRGLR